MYAALGLMAAVLTVILTLRGIGRRRDTLRRNRHLARRRRNTAWQMAWDALFRRRASLRLEYRRPGD